MPSDGLIAAPGLLGLPGFMPVFKWPSVLFSGHGRGHSPGLSDFLSSFLSVFPKLSCFHFCLHFWWLPTLHREMLTFLNAAWNSFLICHNLLLQCCVLPFCGWWLPSCPRHVAHGPVPRSSLWVWLYTLECSCLCGTLQDCLCPVYILPSPQGFRAFCCRGWSFTSLLFGLPGFLESSSHVVCQAHTIHSPLSTKLLSRERLEGSLRTFWRLLYFLESNACHRRNIALETRGLMLLQSLDM